MRDWTVCLLFDRMERDFYNWGLPIGSISRIRVRVHWSLLLLALFHLHTMSSKWSLPTSVWLPLWLLTSGVTFLIILLHEFGHCFAARAVGGDAEEVLLWPLGGLATCNAPNLWRSQFIVAAGGPAVNVVIAAIAYPTFAWLDPLPPSQGGDLYVYYLEWQVLPANLYLLIFNLIPLYPLDGGRIFHSLLWGYLRRRAGGGHSPGAFGRATLVTIYVSRITVGAGIAYAIYGRNFWMFFLFAWAWSGTETLRRQLEQGAEEDFTFGYDFSQGYTSLDRSAPREAKPRRARRNWLRRREVNPTPHTDQLEVERRRGDELLDKINDDGMEALSKEEREFLQNTSRRWKEGRE